MKPSNADIRNECANGICQQPPSSDSTRDQKQSQGINTSFWQYVKTGLLLAMLLFVAARGASGSEHDLFVAVAKGDVVGINVLLAEGTDVNAKDKDGWTPLRMAALKGYKD